MSVFSLTVNFALACVLNYYLVLSYKSLIIKLLTMNYLKGNCLLTDIMLIVYRFSSY